MRMLLDTHQLKYLSLEELEEVFEELRKQVVVSHNTVDEILLWTAGHIKKKHQKSTEFNVLDRINQTLLLFQPQIKQKNLKIENRVSDTIIYNGNLEIFNFVVRNIINNAVKFSPVYSTIVIDLNKGKNELLAQLSVQDYGVGMDRDKINAINTGEIAKDKDAKESESMGLGLSLCQMLAKQADWKIVAESAVGEGSCISLFLPVQILDNERKIEAVA